MSRLVDLKGKKFGRLTVIERVNDRNKRGTFWKCVCECGNETTVNAGHLKDGHTQSCGCIQKEHMTNTYKTHGKTNTKLYKVWRGIIDRTEYPSQRSYQHYGGRGIKMCEEWKNFANFYDWSVTHGYEKGLSIDRIDANGNYEPSNCRWATYIEQENNRRNNRRLTYNGETHTLSEWSRITGIKYTTLRARMQRHWEAGKALGYVL